MNDVTQLRILSVSLAELLTHKLLLYLLFELSMQWIQTVVEGTYVIVMITKVRLLSVTKI